MKFGYDVKDDDVRHDILMELQDIGGLEITNSSTTNLEINPQGISKESGVRTVCQLLGIDMSEVVAVGDSLNDLAVIKAAGLGVAMGNAQATLKEYADVVTASNNEDGIALIIRDYVFGVGSEVCMVLTVIGWILIIALFLVGMAGAVYPVLPGVIAIYLAFFVYGWFFSFEPFGPFFWIIQTLILIVLLVADNIVRSLGR